MLPMNQDESTDSDDPDYVPSHAPPPKRRRTLKSCRKRRAERQKKIRDDEVEFPEEADKKNFQQEVVNAELGFASVGGLDETIEMLRREVILPMEHRRAFEENGAFVPLKGIIFHGPPGTGKTLLAKAMAAELSRIAARKYTFYYHKGADILSRYVGDSETNAKLIFDVAKANKPAIVFFDEMEALCSKRTDNPDNRHETSLVCSILAQMDCIKTGEVLVIGATNRLESIDPAFRREGRFDTEIKFSNPTHEGRKEILKLHFRKWKRINHPNDQRLEDLASRTTGFTGADLKGLCRDAMRSATARMTPILAQSDKKTIQKQMNSLRVLSTDWDKALRERTPTNTNVFGNQDFAGTQLDPSYDPIIGGIKNEMKEWIQGFWGPEITGFNFAVIWSRSEKYLKNIDNIILPSALTALIGNNRKLILMTRDKLEPTEMTKILDEAGNSSLSTLIYFPRLDMMDDNLKTILAESLEKHFILRTRKPAFSVIGSSSRGIDELDESLRELLTIDRLSFEVRRPSDQEVKTFFTPALKICGQRTQRLLGQIVKAARESNVTTLSKLKRALSRHGANIENLIRDFRRLVGQNQVNADVEDSGTEEASENEDDSDDEGGESDSEIEE